MAYNFVITNGILTNLYKKKLLENKWEMKEYIMGSEYENENTENTDIIENVEKIDVFFSNKHLKKYLYQCDVKLHNHIMNIQIFIDYCQLYLDFINKYPKTSKKYMFDSYVYDIVENSYDFERMKKDLKNNLIKNKNYIIKPYNYNNRINKDIIIKNKNDNIIDYVINNKFNCSKWIFMKNIKLSEKKIKVYSLIRMNDKKIRGYVYSEIYDNENKEINKKIKNQIYKLIKKIYSTEFKKLLFGIFCKEAFEILCFEFYITNKNIIKLNNINITFENNLAESKYIDKFVDNVLNLVLLKQKNIFDKIITKNYEIFNDEIVKSFTFYYCDRIENKLDKIEKLKNNIKKYSLQFIYDKPFKALMKIKNSKLIDNKYNGRYTIVMRNIKDYTNYNEITNIIIERCNIKCKFGNSKTMLELSQDKKNIKKIMKTLYENKADVSYKKVALSIYKQTKMCSYFPINITYGFIKHFNVKSMLDISTGWGDRLIASCLADIVYYGADPNTCNIPYYTQMIELFGNKNKQKFNTVSFENLEITDTYDLIFSSPPFFELEKYSEDTEQSYLKYTTSNSWVYDFLFVVIKKAWKHLKKGGNMCLYMNDYYKISYCEEMVNYCIENLDSCKYNGVIGFIISKEDTPEKIPEEYWGGGRCSTIVDISKKIINII